MLSNLNFEIYIKKKNQKSSRNTCDSYSNLSKFSGLMQ